MKTLYFNKIIFAYSHPAPNIILLQHLAKPTAAVLPFKMTKENSKQKEWWTFKAMTVGRRRS